MICTIDESREPPLNGCERDRFSRHVISFRSLLVSPMISEATADSEFHAHRIQLPMALFAQPIDERFTKRGHQTAIAGIHNARREKACGRNALFAMLLSLLEEDRHAGTPSQSFEQFRLESRLAQTGLPQELAGRSKRRDPHLTLIDLFDAFIRRRNGWMDIAFPVTEASGMWTLGMDFIRGHIASYL